MDKAKILIVEDKIITAEDMKKDLSNPESKVEPLSLILKAIRNIDKLITHEKDIDKLIQKSCNILVKIRGYKSAWIALFDDKEQLTIFKYKGYGKAINELKKMFKNKKYCKCVKQAKKQKKPT